MLQSNHLLEPNTKRLRRGQLSELVHPRGISPVSFWWRPIEEPFILLLLVPILLFPRMIKLILMFLILHIHHNYPGLLFVCFVIGLDLVLWRCYRISLNGFCFTLFMDEICVFSIKDILGFFIGEKTKNFITFMEDNAEHHFRFYKFVKVFKVFNLDHMCST